MTTTPLTADEYQRMVDLGFLRQSFACASNGEDHTRCRGTFIAADWTRPPCECECHR